MPSFVQGPVSLPREEYWAAVEDDDAESSKIVSYIQEKIRRHNDWLIQTFIVNRIKRNYAYYYNIGGNIEDIWYDGTAIARLGEEGEILSAQINHLRNHIHHLVILTTQQQPDINALSANNDLDATQQAKLAEDIFWHYRHTEGLEESLCECVRQALIMSMSFMVLEWDPDKGRDFTPETDDADDDLEEVLSEGDVRRLHPTILECAWDPDYIRWDDERDWFVYSTLENRWELAEKYPDHKDDILGHQGFEINGWFRFAHRFESRVTENQQDMIRVFTFLHRPTRALRGGRIVRFVGNVKLDDTYNPYKGIPVIAKRIDAIIGTSLGYTPGFDLQALNEWFDAEVSTLMTAHAACGLPRFWTQSGDELSYSEVATGLGWLQSDMKPEVLAFNHPNPEAWKSLEVIKANMADLSGVNAVTMGQPQPSLRSGKALGLVDAKSLQAATPLSRLYRETLAESCSWILKMLKTFPVTTNKRVIVVTGKSRKFRTRSFTSGDISEVEKVIIEQSNPLMDTLAGRVDTATTLLGIPGMISNPEQYFEVMKTGRLEKMVNSLENQNTLIAEENESFWNGEVPTVSATDNHMLHIREHAGNASNPEVRNNSEAHKARLIHIMKHIEQLQNPGVQMLMVALGYNPGPFVQAPTAGAQKDPPEPEDAAGRPSPPPAKDPGGGGGGGGGGADSPLSPPDTDSSPTSGMAGSSVPQGAS